MSHPKHFQYVTSQTFTKEKKIKKITHHGVGIDIGLRKYLTLRARGGK